MELIFTPAELTKFALLEEGIHLDSEAVEQALIANRGRPLAKADYATTSGVILRLADDVWVNAPTAASNANFVSSSTFTLTVVDEQLAVSGRYGDIPAEIWLQPAWHGTEGPHGPWNGLGVSHTDRVRVSPIEGCAFTCTFCDLPYVFRYRRKSVEGIVDTVRIALSDEIQPAAHVLISGGTPRPEDYGYVRECYEAVLTEFPNIAVDIMMVPLHEVLDLAKLFSLGLREISINLEVWSDKVARRVMPRKHKQGRDYYLEFLREASSVLGGDRVRSMLLVGIEPLEETLEGIETIASLGCVPVLSPFRADPATSLSNWPVATSDVLQAAYRSAWEITQRYNVALGPRCSPCAHNTLTLPAINGHGSATTSHGPTRLFGR